MTPKEKAKQLVDKQNDLCVFNCNLDPEHKMAKKAALICVDEILTDLDLMYKDTPKAIIYMRGGYWQEVRIEIDNVSLL